MFISILNSSSHAEVGAARFAARHITRSRACSTINCHVRIIARLSQIELSICRYIRDN
jgi:hypothetical protein